MAYTPRNPNGQATKANSEPVVLASNQDALPVTDNSGSLTVDNGGTFAVQATEADGANVTLGSKADAKSTATDTTAITIMSVLKQISASIQAAASSLAGSLTVNTHAVTQSGTWTVQPGNTANSTAWKVDASSVAVPITDNSGSLTVDNGGTFVVQENGSWVQADDAAFTPATSKVAVVGFEFDDTSPDLVDEGDAGAARMSARREQYMQIRDAAGNERGVNVNASNQLAVAGPVTNAGTFVVQENGNALTSLQLIDDTVYTDDTSTHATGTSKGLAIMAVANPTDAAVDANDLGVPAMTLARALKNDITSIAGTAAVSGSGTATGALRVEIANNGTGLVGLNAGTNAIGKLAANSGVDIGDVDITSVIPGTGATNLGKAEDAGHTTGDVGVMALAVRTDTPATTASNTGDYDALHTNATGQLQVTQYPDTVGGLSYSTNSIKATATSIKASAGQVYGWYIYNSNSSAVYVQFFNTASGSVTLGTTPPVYSLGIPATAGANVFVPHGIAHSTAIVVAATTTVSGNTAPSNNVDINVFYK